MRHYWRFLVVLIPLLIAFVLQWESVSRLFSMHGFAAPTPALADIVITETGCTTTRFVLPADHQPQMSLLNQSTEPMVFTLPRMANAVAVAPGERVILELPRYIMGEFDFFCMTERAHVVLGGSVGGETVVCGVDSQAIRPLALTSGTLIIEPHTRLEQLLGATASPALVN